MNCIETTWNTLTIEHKEPVDQKEKAEMESYIKSQAGRKNGLYIYHSENGSCLYVGNCKWGEEIEEQFFETK